MIEDPDRWAPAYVEAGAGSVTFHVGGGRRPGAARPRDPRQGRPGLDGAQARPRPIEPYEDLLPELDMLLIMTVEPGFGGQAFLDIMLPKIRRTRELIDKHGLDLWLQVDGGVSAETDRALRGGRRRRLRRGLGGLRRGRPGGGGTRAARAGAPRGHRH